MYVEISPRQSGKTTRLVQAVINYLQQNTEHTVAVVGFNIRAKNELKEKISRQINSSNIVIDDDWAHRVNFLSGNLFGKYNREPNYWFLTSFPFYHQVIYYIQYIVMLFKMLITVQHRLVMVLAYKEEVLI